MALSKLDKIKTLGERLYQLRRQITDAEEASRLSVAPMKEEKERVQGELIAAFKAAGIASIKVAAGDTVTVANRAAYAILNPISAFFWAKEHGAVKIDSIALKQKLEQADPATLPEGVFSPVVEEYISVRKPKPPKKLDGDLGAEEIGGDGL